ncbi:MAG: hypothetical protein KDJ41_15835 [Hyphomicrobiaceae bacterium]|nr:hypothetical protein [Hyphomicrobiaceae bacterium]
MLDRLWRGWAMVKGSWSVLKQHPKLLVFPIASGIAILAIAATFLGSFGVFSQKFGLEIEHLFREFGQYGLMAVLFVFYFICFFVAIFFNSALAFCALEALAGREPSLRKGMSVAMSRLPQILGWALVASTVGLLLNMIQQALKERLGFIGDLLGGLLGMAWAIATYFVVPVLVVERVGPVTAIKRSGEILRKTWGEAVAGEGGMGIIAALFILPAVGLLMLAAASAGSIGAGTVALFGVAFLYILAVSIVFGTLGAIFRTGVYVYATTGKAPPAFGQDLVDSAFHPKG